MRRTAIDIGFITAPAVRKSATGLGLAANSNPLISKVLFEPGLATTGREDLAG